MNTVDDVLSYAQTHNISLIAENGQLKIDAPKTALTDDFLESAKLHKSEILEVLTKEDRWSPELAEKGYVWCFDCKYWNSQTCSHPDNPFRKQCAQAPRKCRWYESATHKRISKVEGNRNGR